MNIVPSTNNTKEAWERIEPMEEDLAYQEHALLGVSRTFALTIPRLPKTLRIIVGNAYLLCRIADTIEDSASLSVDEKGRFSKLFADVVAGSGSAEELAHGLYPRLDHSTTPEEQELIRHIPAVIRVTETFPTNMRTPLYRCVRIMTEGMETFQEGRFADGLKDMPHMDAYCYCVAGIVGEMLTDLFRAYNPRIDARGEALASLAVSFGQGLQMTNILKDIWEDKQRGACWLPQEVFKQHGFELTSLSIGNHGEGFQRGLDQLIGYARGHLENALRYTLLIPRRETGIREFCLWAIGMAVLTLRNIHRHKDFTRGKDVKISRRSVYAVVMGSRCISKSNSLLRLAFSLLCAGLPESPR